MHIRKKNCCEICYKCFNATNIAYFATFLIFTNVVSPRAMALAMALALAVSALAFQFAKAIWGPRGFLILGESGATPRSQCRQAAVFLRGVCPRSQCQCQSQSLYRSIIEPLSSQYRDRGPFAGVFFLKVNHTAKQIVPFRAKHTAKQIVPFRAKHTAKQIVPFRAKN